MRNVFDIASAYSIPIQASVERHMKCGIRIGGSCCIGEQLVCKDGTIFSDKQLSEMIEFGMLYRDKTGQKVVY